MKSKLNSHFLVYYYILFSILSSATSTCPNIYEKRICCIKRENLRKILSMFVDTLRNDKYNKVIITENTFKKLISELDYYGTIMVKVREGREEGRGYKRYVIIYEADTASAIRRCIGSIISNDLLKFIEEKISELKNGNAKIYFDDLIIGKEECVGLLKDVGFTLYHFSR